MGTVQFVLLADDPATFVTRVVPFIDIELAGIPGDRHYGLLRPADSRQKIYNRGTPIANRRQISIVSEEECALIAEKMNIPEVRPEWLGANMLVRGVDRLTEMPAGTRLLFPNGTGLICEGENLPCVHPGKMIEQFYEQDGLRKKFVPAAFKKRGIVCSVEREGIIHTGDTIEIIRLS